MRKYCLITIVISIFILQACVTPQGRRQDYVDDHPDLSADISSSILKGEISKGMNREDVKAAWGDPERETLSLTDNEKQNQEIWFGFFLENMMNLLPSQIKCQLLALKKML